MGWHGLEWAWNSHSPIPVSYPLQGQIGTYFSLEVCGKILGCVSGLLTHNTLPGRDLLRKLACCRKRGSAPPPTPKAGISHWKWSLPLSSPWCWRRWLWCFCSLPFCHVLGMKLKHAQTYLISSYPRSFERYYCPIRAITQLYHWTMKL